MVEERDTMFENRTFKNRWLDFNLRDNVYDGRCFREAETPPDNTDSQYYQYVYVPGQQTQEFIDSWTYDVYSDRSEMTVSFRWSVVRDQKECDYYLGQAATINGNPNSTKEKGITSMYVNHSPYTRAVIRLYRIDDPSVEAIAYDFTSRTYIGILVQTPSGKITDTGQKQFIETVYLRSDMKYSGDYGTTWQSITFDSKFNGPEKSGKLQTNTFYYLTIEDRQMGTELQKTQGYPDKNESVPYTEYELIKLTAPKNFPGIERDTISSKILYSRNRGDNFYNENDRWTNNDFFAWFRTPATFEGKKIATPSVRWNVWSDISAETATTNPNTSGDLTATEISLATFEVTLKGTFFYETIDIDTATGGLKIPLDYADFAGFSVRDVTAGTGFNNVQTFYVPRDLSKYVQQLPSGSDNTRHFDFEHTIRVLTGRTYQYRIWIQKGDGTYWYANYPTPAGYKASTNPTDFNISVPAVNITSWVNPNPSSEGFWYQMYPAWYRATISSQNIFLANTTPSLPKPIVPYFTIYKLPPLGSIPTVNQNVAINADYPVHYYLNYTFNEGKTFQFRTIVDNFYTFRTDTSSKKADLLLLTPWGERVPITTPYISLTTVPNQLRKFNLYVYANINGYTWTNNEPIKTIAINRESVPAKPRQIVSSKSNPQNPITYTAKPYFGGYTSPNDTGMQAVTSGLCHVSVFDFDWLMQGTATYNVMTQNVAGAVQTANTQAVPYFYNNEPFAGRGWHYLAYEKRFVWFDKIGYGIDKIGTITALNSNFPVGGDPGNYFSDKSEHLRFLSNNFIASYISYQNFNVTFDYVNEGPFAITIYLGGELPYSKEDALWWKTDIDDLIAKGTVRRVGILPPATSKTGVNACEFVGLIGNQFLFFVADTVVRFGTDDNVTTGLFTQGSDVNNARFEQDTSGFGYPINTETNVSGFGTYSTISISNFRFSGTYNVENNKVFDTTNYSATIANAAYTIKLGTGNNVFPGSANSTVTINTSAGNGSFNSGTWENGVWNSGWRDDFTVKEFTSVDNYFFYSRGRLWRMSIAGNPASLQDFSAGDVVSISNVVAIDINENRKLLSKYYKVLSVDERTITVEFDTNFPIKRIEKDSDDHRILVSKNIWLSGVFLNGYFNGGIWNNGLFSGYPFITKMERSHWIDGIFNGGHFNAVKYKTQFTAVRQALYDGTPRLELVFNNPHTLEANDTISITYSDAFSIVKTFGTTTVLAATNSLSVVTGIEYDKSYKNIKGGTVNSTLSSGLIQNFRFYSNNASTVTSLNTLVADRVFSYNSWIDVNYSNKSAVNIGRPQTSIETSSERSYSENNLYGYPTNDVLSSDSVFRDSFSLALRRYKLGTKYRIISDLVGNASTFEQAFGPTDTEDGMVTFEDQGWTTDLLPDRNIRMFAKTQAMDMDGFLSLTYVNVGIIAQLKPGDNINVNGPIVYDDGTVLQGKPRLYPVRTRSVTTPITYISIPDTLTNTVTISTGIPVYDYTGEFWDVSRIFGAHPNYKENGLFWIEVTKQSVVTISRTPEPLTSNTPLVGKEMKVVAANGGGIVNLIPTDSVANRKNGKELETISRLKYTVVEFEVADYKTTSTTTTLYQDETGNFPPIHFNNLNYVTRQTRDINGNKVLRTLGATYLPIYRNVNHVATPGRKKQEFFFNKRNLMMNFTGSGTGGTDENEFYLDNLKFYEVDMIPFFQYFRNPVGRAGSINVSVQIPNTGTSPTLNISEDEIIDASVDNEVVNEFVARLVASNVQVPVGINWRRDYAIYRTQGTGGSFNPSIYKGN